MLDAVDARSPVVGRSVVLELEGAYRVGDPFDGVADGVGEVVHRIDAPLVPCARVGGELDAVEGRVAEVHVGTCHVDLGPQRV